MEYTSHELRAFLSERKCGIVETDWILRRVALYAINGVFTESDLDKILPDESMHQSFKEYANKAAHGAKPDKVS